MSPQIHLIKGPEKDHWRAVAALQHQPFIYIRANGCGDTEEDLSALLHQLAHTPLDPQFENCETFIVRNPCIGITNPQYDSICPRYIGGPPVYVCDNVIRFIGAFLLIRYGFTIDTNHPDTITALTTAIRNNQRSHAYQTVRMIRPALYHTPTRRDDLNRHLFRTESGLTPGVGNTPPCLELCP